MNEEFRQKIFDALPPDGKHAVIEGAMSMLCRVDSDERLGVMLALLRRKPVQVFWPVFLETWSICDNTWDVHKELVSELRRRSFQSPGQGYLSDDARRFLDSLPDPVRVFRGCSRQRVKGVSWTTDRKVACGFAHGHRLIRVPKPVIATGLITKSDVFGVSVDRSETDVILDPRQVRDLEIAPVDAAKFECAPQSV